MILRLWHGYTRKGKDADTYDRLLRETILPGIHRVDGYKGAYMLRRESIRDEVEFITITLWESMDAIRRFAGPEFAKAVIHPEAAPLLTHYDEESAHYDATWCP